MRTRNAIIGLAIVAVVGGWYAFRPERLFVNKTVSESFPVPILKIGRSYVVPVQGLLKALG